MTAQCAPDQSPSGASTEGFFPALRSGDWLTPERLRVYPLLIGALLAGAVVSLAVLSYAAPAFVKTPIGIDFGGVWVAGQAVLAGHPTLPYDNAANAAAQARFFHSQIFLPWPYPPYFLGVAAMLAALPFPLALLVWQGGTLALYLCAIAAAVRGSGLGRWNVVVTALAFPAVAINVMHGQNGLLTAGLLAGAGFALPKRKWLAGVLFGCLVFKPQFALAIPVAVLAAGYWRCVLAGAATVLGLTFATLAEFGTAPWAGFASSLGFTRKVILESGGLEPFKMQSAFAAVRLLGGSVPLAYAVQGSVACMALAGLAWLWRSRSDPRLKVAGLVTASLLATPYAVDYDFVMLGPALAALVAFGVARGFPPYARTLLAITWTMPLLARVAAMSLLLPVGVLVVVAFYGLILRMAVSAMPPPPSNVLPQPSRS